MNSIIKKIVESKYNFNIDIEDNGKHSLSKSPISITGSIMTQKQLYEFNDYLVDMGLPSGTIWCKYNLGAKNDQLDYPKGWYGNYYAWGEIEEKESYNWRTYKFDDCNTLTKYNCNDKLSHLTLEDDAAYQDKIHTESFKYRIPSKEQFEELLEHTIVHSFINYKAINGLSGKVLESKINGKKLFFPSTGFQSDASLISFGYEGWYWTSDLDTNSYRNAYSFWFSNHDTDITISIDYRKSGITIRPVLYQQK